MAKKPSAKQKAARARFSRIMKSGGFKKRKRKSVSTKSRVKRRVTRRRSSPVKTIRKSIRRRFVAKRRMASRKKSGFKIPGLSNPLVKKAAAGIGTGVILTTVLGAIGQGGLAANPAVKAIAGFAGGDIIGAAASLFISGGLGNIFGGGASPQGGGI